MQNGDVLQVLQIIWPDVPEEDFRQDVYSNFLSFVRLQMNLDTPWPKASGQIAMAGRNIVSLIRDLAQTDDLLSSKDRAIDCAKKLAPSDSPSVDPALLYASLDLALRIMLSLDVRTAPQESYRSPTVAPASIIKWEHDSSLEASIKSHFFSRQPFTTSTSTGRIDATLSIPYLCSTKSFRVLWTSNLADHLSINWKSRIIIVYEHKIVLWNHLQTPKRTIIPHTILEEAIDTFNLIFPLNDPLTKSFLRQNGKSFYGLGYCGRPRSSCLDLGHFQHWKHRVADLVEIMNQEPRGVKQLALERNGKNLLPFLTFWVAIGVALLAFLSIPFAIVSMYYSKIQYELARDLACLDPEARQALSRYCA